jgi:hypothetical protein
MVSATNIQVILEVGNNGMVGNAPDVVVHYDNFYATVDSTREQFSDAPCKVYGWLKDTLDLPIQGAIVEANIPDNAMRIGTILLNTFTLSDTTDANGYWELELLPNSILTPLSTKYKFLAYNDSGRLGRKTIAVPDLTEWELEF